MNKSFRITTPSLPSYLQHSAGLVVKWEIANIDGARGVIDTLGEPSYCAIIQNNSHGLTLKLVRVSSE